MTTKFLILLVALAYFKEVASHGMMLDPANRASAWRYFNTPVDYDDNAFNCGGFWTQWHANGGKCGTCGDNYADPIPRSNENTGTYGKGIVTRTYHAGQVIDTSVTLTANHLGTFTYSLCVLQDPSKPETEECFEDLKLADGSPVYNVDAADYIVSNKVQLPEGITCDRCVLRWHYKAGNSWGTCDDGRGAMGCGAQESFRSCSDIRILP